ncbi:flagellar hook-length control protein FliK [Rhizobium sp. FY34]|uniref:flagellar hook-length control protein FliK n=1 Tax=Rhizobium sp. FY34 TaxID=2562309 RepID=UPI0010C0F84B|nr:flagellar hook-length control protein FliK [Rhizobium sp. FY34]
MYTPGLPASPSATGASSTSAPSSRSSKSESETFSNTLSSQSDRYDTRSVSDEEQSGSGAPEDGEETSQADGRIKLRASTTSTSRLSITSLNEQFQLKREALSAAQSAAVSLAQASDGEAADAELDTASTAGASRRASAAAKAQTAVADPGALSQADQADVADGTRVASAQAGKTAAGGKSDGASSQKPTTAAAADAGIDGSIVAKLAAGTASVKGQGNAHQPEASVADETDASAISIDQGANGGEAAGAVLSLLSSDVVGAGVLTTARHAAEVTGSQEAPSRLKAVEHSSMPEGSGISDGSVMPSDETLPVGHDRTFRFSSMREGPASMDMTIGTNADGTTRFDTARASSSGAEGVVVLDSRRFLGFGLSANGAALTSALSGDPEWTAAMQPGASLSNAAAQSSTGQVVNTLKLQMTPIELGLVTATLRLSGEALSVHLTVENRAAHTQLSEDSSSIMEALKNQGFSVDQVTVSIAPASQADSTGQMADPGQRGPAGDKQFDGGAGQGGEQSSSSSGSGETSGRRENEPHTDTGPVIAAGSARPQQLYI